MERNCKKEVQYNNAKFYQIGLFSLNNAATNLYLALMGYVSYYANSLAGFGVMLVSVMLTALPTRWSVFFSIRPRGGSENSGRL